MQFHDLMSVAATAEPDVYIAHVDLTDYYGHRSVQPYGSRPNPSGAGLSVAVRVAVEQWVADGKPVDPYVEPDPQPDPVPDEISRRQFYQGLAIAEFITTSAALAAMDGILPEPIQAIVDDLTDPAEQFNAAMLLKGASTFMRSHPLVAIFAAAQDLSQAEVDDFWRLCTGLN